MGRYVFKLPDVGEGTAEAELVAWHVKVGDVVEEDQVIVRYFNVGNGETEYYRVNMRTGAKTFIYNGSGRQQIAFTDPREGRILVRQGIEAAGDGDWRVET